jgi:hypothetical protein
MSGRRQQLSGLPAALGSVAFEVRKTPFRHGPDPFLEVAGLAKSVLFSLFAIRGLSDLVGKTTPESLADRLHGKGRGLRDLEGQLVSFRSEILVLHETVAEANAVCLPALQATPGIEELHGLLLTDDISMGALGGPMAARVTGSLAAGCDAVLHCNGEGREMEEIAAATPDMTALALARFAAGRPGGADDFDVAAGLARLTTLMGRI